MEESKLCVVGSPYFAKRACILFLNKRDLFDDCVKQVAISKIIPDFYGDERNPRDVLEFLVEEYRSRFIDTSEYERTM
ncbi:MAG: hypothetical protein MHM6MM_003690 [Cercozoa sp. M6MM]